jgi:hypothetical protein
LTPKPNPSDPWQDACLALDLLQQDEMEIHWDDLLDAIIDRNEFSEAEADCAKKCLEQLGEAREMGWPTYITWSALHILKWADANGRRLEEGFILGLKSSPKQSLGELSRFWKHLPNTPSMEFSRTLLSCSKIALKSLGFDEYLFAYRPLAKRCELLLKSQSSQPN